MNKYTKEFFHRGLMFGGFGPMVAAIIFVCIPEVQLTGAQVLQAVVSTYLLAFVHAGASVFNQIEHWPLAKALLCHFSSLYLAYSLCYLVNSWIAFEPMALVVFTGIFVGIYFVVWGIVYVCIRATGKKMNRHIR